MDHQDSGTRHLRDDQYLPEYDAIQYALADIVTSRQALLRYLHTRVALSLLYSCGGHTRGSLIGFSRDAKSIVCYVQNMRVPLHMLKRANLSVPLYFEQCRINWDARRQPRTAAPNYLETCELLRNLPNTDPPDAPKRPRDWSD